MRKLFIYLLQRNDVPTDYDIYLGFVIVAYSAKEAKELIDKHTTASISDFACTKVGKYTGKRKTPHIMLADFRNG